MTKIKPRRAKNPKHMRVDDLVIRAVSAHLEIAFEQLKQIVDRPAQHWTSGGILGREWQLRDRRDRARSGTPSWFVYEHPPEHYRPLWKPSDELKDIQRAINRVFFCRLRVHKSTHGFVRGRSVKTKMLEHFVAGNRHFLRVDIYKAFGRVSRNQVVRFLERELETSKDRAKVLARLTVWQGSLPQGAPTSPVLFSAMLCRVVESLERVMRASGTFGDFVMTVYADDLVFSSDRPFTRDSFRIVSDHLASEGFSLNWDKVHFTSLDEHAVRLPGVVISKDEKTDEQKFGIPNQMLRRIRAVLHKGLRGEIPPEEVWGLAGYLFFIYGRNPDSLPSSVRKLAREWLTLCGKL